MLEIESDARAKYSDTRIYSPDSITHSLLESGEGYSLALLAEKAKTLMPYVGGRRVLDLGCANGRHLAEIAAEIEYGIGLDFSAPFIGYAKAHLAEGRPIDFAVADGRSIPLATGSIECAYSFATMYHIDDVAQVYAEIARVLTPDGIVVLEVGNARSFATLVSRQFPDVAPHSHRTIGEHLSMLRRHNLRTISWRSFQILPMWGDRPRWLQALRAPWLERLIARRIAGRMLDEWISSLPGFRRLAFRHLIVCRKASG